jgi:membrane-associated phospholipid phosphatase
VRRFWVAALLLFPTAAQAEVRDLRFSAAGDGAATLVLGAGWIGSELAKSHLAPDHCRWCDPPGFDQDVRDRWKWSDPAKADTYSNVADFAVLPAMVFGADAILASREGALRKSPEDALMIAEAAVAASAIDQVVKFSVGRERPFVHALPDSGKGSTAQPSDNDVSFYSGHTSLAFALVASSATVGQMRGYRDAWVIWPAGIAAASAIGYLRIAADKHYLSDVVTGAVMGTAAGVAIPLLVHGRAGSGPAVALSPERNGPKITIAFVF